MTTETEEALATLLTLWYVQETPSTYCGASAPLIFHKAPKFPLEGESEGEIKVKYMRMH